MVLGVLLLGMLAACSPAGETDGVTSQSQIDEILKRGVLKVGLDIFVPWAFKDKDGNLVGFEIDVATKLAEDMGVDVEFVPTEWSGIIPALLTGKFDVIIGGMGVTTERALKVNFSDPYEWSGIDVVVNKNMLPGAHLAGSAQQQRYRHRGPVGSNPRRKQRKHTRQMPNCISLIPMKLLSRMC